MWTGQQQEYNLFHILSQDSAVLSHSPLGSKDKSQTYCHKQKQTKKKGLNNTSAHTLPTQSHTIISNLKLWTMTNRKGKKVWSSCIPTVYILHATEHSLQGQLQCVLNLKCIGGNRATRFEYKSSVHQDRMQSEAEQGEWVTTSNIPSVSLKTELFYTTSKERQNHSLHPLFLVANFKPI